MAVQLPPIPNNPITDTFVWRDWFFKVSQLLVQQASIAWSSIDFTGSNLLDIQTRQHNALQAVQGGLSGQYYHLTAAEHAAVVSLPTFPIPMSDVVTGYGSFQNTANQTFSAANTPTQLVVNTTDFIKGMTRSGSTITDITPGIYNLQYSLQMANTDTSIHEIEIWLRKNGSDLAGTATKFSVTSSHGGTDGYMAPACNFFLQLSTTDTVELWASVSNTALFVEAYAAQTTPYTRPSIPSTVFTLSQVA